MTVRADETDRVTGTRTRGVGRHHATVQHHPPQEVMERHEAQLRARLRECPGSAELWTYLGLHLRRQGRFQEALGALGRAVELDPHDARAWAALALVRGDLGDEAGRRAAIEDMLRHARRERA